MANRHGIGESFPCDKCDYKAWCPAKLRDHVRVKHEGENFLLVSRVNCVESVNPLFFDV